MYIILSADFGRIQNSVFIVEILADIGTSITKNFVIMKLDDS